MPIRGGGVLRTLTTPRLRTAIRQWLGPLTLAGAARRLQTIIQTLSPDIIHAMRIPYEGMIAALAVKRVSLVGAKTQPLATRNKIPLLISVWGNDFTLHANSTPLMARYTRLAIQQAFALHTDCYRDVRLA
ncbi:MAG: hypothetical protein HC806_04335, partial [Anaerolineae bacterium]|nr:hypothetical protein [Anaerolineae bacterium]